MKDEARNGIWPALASEMLGEPNGNFSSRLTSRIHRLDALIEQGRTHPLVRAKAKLSEHIREVNVRRARAEAVGVAAILATIDGEIARAERLMAELDAALMRVEWDDPLGSVELGGGGGKSDLVGESDSGDALSHEMEAVQAVDEVPLDAPTTDTVEPVIESKPVAAESPERQIAAKKIAKVRTEIAALSKTLGLLGENDGRGEMRGVLLALAAHQAEYCRRVLAANRSADHEDWAYVEAELDSGVAALRRMTPDPDVLIAGDGHISGLSDRELETEIERLNEKYKSVTMALLTQALRTSASRPAPAPKYLIDPAAPPRPKVFQPLRDENSLRAWVGDYRRKTRELVDHRISSTKELVQAWVQSLSTEASFIYWEHRKVPDTDATLELIEELEALRDEIRDFAVRRAGIDLTTIRYLDGPLKPAPKVESDRDYDRTQFERLRPSHSASGRHRRAPVSTRSEGVPSPDAHEETRSVQDSEPSVSDIAPTLLPSSQAIDVDDLADVESNESKASRDVSGEDTSVTEVIDPEAAEAEEFLRHLEATSPDEEPTDVSAIEANRHRGACDGQRAVILGGRPNHKMEGRLKDHFGFSKITWEETEKSGSDSNTWASRIASGKYDVVLVLGRFLARVTQKAVRDACKSHGVAHLVLQQGVSVGHVSQAIDAYDTTAA